MPCGISNIQLCRQCSLLKNENEKEKISNWSELNWSFTLRDEERHLASVWGAGIYVANDYFVFVFVLLVPFTGSFSCCVAMCGAAVSANVQHAAANTCEPCAFHWFMISIWCHSPSSTSPHNFSLSLALRHSRAPLGGLSSKLQMPNSKSVASKRNDFKRA